MAKKRRKLKKQFIKLIKVIVLIILFIILCEVLSSFITKKTFKLVEIHNNDYFSKRSLVYSIFIIIFAAQSR